MSYEVITTRRGAGAYKDPIAAMHSDVSTAAGEITSVGCQAQ